MNPWDRMREADTRAEASREKLENSWKAANARWKKSGPSRNAILYILLCCVAIWLALSTNYVIFRVLLVVLFGFLILTFLAIWHARRGSKNK